MSKKINEVGNHINLSIIGVIIGIITAGHWVFIIMAATNSNFRTVLGFIVIRKLTLTRRYKPLRPVLSVGWELLIFGL